MKYNIKYSKCIKYGGMNNDPINILNRHEYKVFPEGYLNNEYTSEGYINLWFNKNNNSSPILQDNYIIMLHNSWTPYEFKNMDEKSFLESDILLSKLLKNLQIGGSNNEKDYYTPIDIRNKLIKYI